MEKVFREGQSTNFDNIKMQFSYSHIYAGEAVRIDKYIGSAKHVIIPNKINDLPVAFIGEAAFSGCTNLTTVIIEGLSDIGKEAFSGCTSLMNLILPCFLFDYYDEYGGFTGNLAGIGNGAFMGCESLTNVIIEGVAEIGNLAFRGCESLTEIKIKGAFSGELKIDDWAFGGCKSLTNVIIEGVAEIGNSAFRNCTSLTEITIKYGIEKIGDSVFSGCNKLRTVYFSEFILSEETIKSSFNIDKIREELPFCRVIPISG